MRRDVHPRGSSGAAAPDGSECSSRHAADARCRRSDDDARPARCSAGPPRPISPDAVAAGKCHNVRMTGVKAAFVALLILLTAAACVHTQAKIQPEPPPLDVPPAPPRVVQPTPADEVPQVPDTAATGSAPVKPPAGRAGTPRAEAPKAEAAKPDAAKPETPSEATKAAAQPDVTRAATLETPLPGGESEATYTIKKQLGKANDDLNHVNTAGLSKDGKSQYDAARGFIEQAEQALKERNFVYASKLADKAATLASLLLGR
jgi:hypothetical protein